jgi:hypothetical protein
MVARPSRSPGFRIVLLPAPSRPSGQWLLAGFVPGYSDGVAADSHRLPWGPRLAGYPDTNDAVTVSNPTRSVNPRRHTASESYALLGPLPDGLSAAASISRGKLFDLAR